jgi:hypothetical protein
MLDKWQLDWIRRSNNSDGLSTGACTFATRPGMECGAPCRRVINRFPVEFLQALQLLAGVENFGTDMRMDK